MDTAAAIQALRRDSTHGAGYLAREAVLIMKNAAACAHTTDVLEFRHEVRDLAGVLMNSRPDMALIHNLVNCLMQQYEQLDLTFTSLNTLRRQFIELADQILQEWTDARQQAIARAVHWIADQPTLLTCSYSSTFCEVMLEAARQGHHPNILVLNSQMSDSTPAYGRLTQEELAKHRIVSKLLPDRAVREATAQADMVILGADSILADGSLINGFPSCSLGTAAHHRGIPLYPVCETCRFTQRTPPLQLEAGFDLLEPTFITGILTEKGCLPPARVKDFISPAFNSNPPAL